MNTKSMVCLSEDTPFEAYGSLCRYPAEHEYHGHSPLPLLRRPLMGQPAGCCISCWTRCSRCRGWNHGSREAQHRSWRKA